MTGVSQKKSVSGRPSDQHSLNGRDGLTGRPGLLVVTCGFVAVLQRQSVTHACFFGPLQLASRHAGRGPIPGRCYLPAGQSRDSFRTPALSGLDRPTRPYLRTGQPLTLNVLCRAFLFGPLVKAVNSNEINSSIHLTHRTPVSQARAAPVSLQ